MDEEIRPFQRVGAENLRQELVFISGFTYLTADRWARNGYGYAHTAR